MISPARSATDALVEATLSPVKPPVAILLAHIEKSRLGSRIAETGSLAVRSVVNVCLKILGEEASAELKAEVHRDIVQAMQGLGLGRAEVPLRQLHLLINMVCATGLTPADMEQVRRRADDRRVSRQIAFEAEHRAQLVPFGAVGEEPIMNDPGFSIVPDDHRSSVETLRELYRTLSPEEFCMHMLAIKQQKADAEERLQEALTEKQAMARSRAYYRGQCVLFKGQRDEAREQMVRLQKEINFRPGKRWISLIGGYTLALKRNIGHASTRAIVPIVAGEDMRGAFKDPKMVVKFEHRTCVGQRLASKQVYQDFMLAFAEPVAESHMNQLSMTCLMGEWHDVQYIQYIGDASNVEAVQKEKVHVGQVSSMNISVKLVIESQNPAKERYPYTRSITDLQRVRSGSA